jgi:hypothetical protein
MIYTRVAAVDRYQVERFEYLKDMLDRIPDYPHHKVADLLPQSLSS